MRHFTAMGSQSRVSLAMNIQGIYAPEMLLDLTTPRVLIMEWIEGRRLRRAGKDGFGPTQAELQDDLKLVEIGVQCSLEQVCARPLILYGDHDDWVHPTPTCNLPYSRGCEHLHLMLPRCLAEDVERRCILHHLNTCMQMR